MYTLEKYYEKQDMKILKWILSWILRHQLHAHLLIKGGHILFFIFLIPEHVSEKGGGLHTGKVWPQPRELWGTTQALYLMIIPRNCESYHFKLRALAPKGYSSEYTEAHYLKLLFCRSVSAISIQQLGNHGQAQVSTQLPVQIHSKWILFNGVLLQKQKSYKAAQKSDIEKYVKQA